MKAAQIQKRTERVDRANRLIEKIATTGRRFFAGEFAGKASPSIFFIKEDTGRIWFRDAYTRKEFAVNCNGNWRGFTNGGTMRGLVLAMRDYIRDGDPERVLWLLGPWPEWVCEGDLWGYGAEAMEGVRAFARETLQPAKD